MTIKEQIKESAEAVRSKTRFHPNLGIILGTGLTQLADYVDTDTVISYKEIPHFPEPTVESHHGRLVLGVLSGQKVLVMQGRFHYYEGYNLKQITHPVRVMKELGVKTLIVSNASGGLNPQFQPGDIVVITDHINLSGHNPLRGPNDESLGPRFPDMFQCYEPKLIARAEKTALDLHMQLRRGVYAWVTGPNLETAAECRYIRKTGADMVGMSTVPEVLVAHHAGLQVLGFSVITDMGLADALKPVDLAEVLRVARNAEPKLTTLLLELLKRTKTFA
ncbi:purine-nucleoside phosphorylase [candidate division WOR-3 bacterium JGI_Cruoil_03_51_56]|uniref:Purine nucleoside phosphorylase n=1 Tax=candidate division WOR-3 bacterium JGI_Cruoil_03_51_56 TaxID=1973747 RepID=A0A235BPD1_UNCW3|nr:MAG: purine-nucleoside phosphorylase [candidate division WOR-3 bacterium JGI_Cruoil_03_51_56]